MKNDVIRWNEHLYIFEVKDDPIKGQWISSELKEDQVGTFTCTGPGQKKSFWKWQGYGAYRVG